MDRNRELERCWGELAVTLERVEEWQFRTLTLDPFTQISLNTLVLQIRNWSSGARHEPCIASRFVEDYLQHAVDLTMTLVLELLDERLLAFAFSLLELQEEVQYAR